MPADDQTRRAVGTPDELAALAHPLRLDLLNHLMSSGPATASQCARAIGDTPSNCSYHLRYLARHGLVEPAQEPEPPQEPEPTQEPQAAQEPQPAQEPQTAQETGQRDNRERPWRATITGFSFGSSGPQAKTLAAITLQRDHRLAREYLGRVDDVDEAWREAGGLATYTLRMTPTELAELYQRLDALIRPFIAATRGPVDGGELVHLGLNAFALETGR